MTKQSHKPFKFVSDRFFIIENPQEAIFPSDSKEWAMITLCLSGSCRLSINNTTYTLGKNDLIIYTPNKTIDNTMICADFTGIAIGMSSQYSRYLFLNSVDIWNKVLYLNRNTKIHIDNSDTAEFKKYYKLLKSTLVQTDNIHYNDIIRCLLKAFSYDVANQLNRFLPAGNDDIMTSKDQLMKKFVDNLATTYPHRRDVNYYSRQLNVTPKYLSTVVKDVSGKTASKWIHDAVTSDIVTLLKNSGKSIKEICNELDFPNIQFFSRYVKRYIGVAPTDFRKELNTGLTRQH